MNCKRLQLLLTKSGPPGQSTPTLSKKELRRQRVAKRNLHYNILGGPSYTPDFGLLIGGGALMTFRMNPSNLPTTFGGADGHRPK